MIYNSRTNFQLSLGPILIILYFSKKVFLSFHLSEAMLFELLKPLVIVWVSREIKQQ